MNAVEWKWGAGLHWWPANNDPNDAGHVNNAWAVTREAERLHVRYDNGQLCTFRRKPAKQGEAG